MFVNSYTSKNLANLSRVTSHNQDDFRAFLYKQLTHEYDPIFYLSVFFTQIEKRLLLVSLGGNKSNQA